jgi:hypothetical protein
MEPTQALIVTVTHIIALALGVSIVVIKRNWEKIFYEAKIHILKQKTSLKEIELAQLSKEIQELKIYLSSVTAEKQKYLQDYEDLLNKTLNSKIYLAQQNYDIAARKRLMVKIQDLEATIRRLTKDLEVAKGWNTRYRNTIKTLKSK